MADSKTVAVSQWSPGFVQDLLPAAEKTALLYHISYLCLGNFPDLERTIRSQAVETRLLFGSSDATMLKCILTSENLVQSLFPVLVIAVENTDADLAKKILRKAQDWITDIVTDLNKIVEKYEKHSKDVASATSDVVKEKDDTDKKITVQDQKLKLTEKALNDMKSKLQKTTAELDETEKKINSKSQEIQEYAKSITQASKGLGIFAAIVPFIGPLVKSIYDAEHDSKDVAQLKALEAQLNILVAEKTALKQKQWQVQHQIMDQQMKAAKASFDRSSIPDPIHLNEVQKSLSDIQDILVQLKNFWENSGKLLASLEQKTFSREHYIDNLRLYKLQFLESIKMANEAWSWFGAGCRKASVMFKLQNKYAYKFLEVSPSSLSKEEWEKEYESVKKQLEEIDPPQGLKSSDRPAISE